MATIITNVNLLKLNEPTITGRIYSTEAGNAILKQWMDRHSSMGAIYGELDRSVEEGFDSSLSLVSHTVENIRIEGNNMIGDIKILSTHCGKILTALIDRDMIAIMRERKINSVLDNIKYIQPSIEDFGIRAALRAAGHIDKNNKVYIKKFFTFDICTTNYGEMLLKNSLDGYF
jgi:hypothetical protein